VAKRGGSHNSPASKPELKSIVSFEPLTQWIEVGVYGKVFSLSFVVVLVEISVGAVGCVPTVSPGL
jgi:hypothetical protein